MIIPDLEHPEQLAINDETGALCPAVWLVTGAGVHHHIGYVVRIGSPDSTEGGANAGVDIYHHSKEAADAAERWLGEGATVIISEIR